MDSNTTTAARPAIPERYRSIRRVDGRVIEPDLVVMLRVSAKPWGREGAPQKCDAILEGKEIVSRETDPEHGACRALKSLGVAGQVLFVHPTGTPGLGMDVESGAALTTADDDSVLHKRAYRPFRQTDVVPAAENASLGTEGHRRDEQAAIDAPPTSVAMIDGPSDDELELLVGGAR